MKSYSTLNIIHLFHRSSPHPSIFWLNLLTTNDTMMMRMMRMISNEDESEDDVL